MKQYNQIKAKHPQAMLLFRVGDFYETFGEDAVKASKILGIVLTKRKNGSASHIELAGFPHHSLNTYLPKLVRAGERVAICDQLEDPKTTKTIVKRGVTELVTPGVAINDQVLEQKKNNFLCALHFDKKQVGVAFLDISTGEFFVAQGNLEYVHKLVQGFAPSEIIFQKNKNKEFTEAFSSNFYTYKLEDWVFTEDFALDTLTKQFNTQGLKGFGIDNLTQGIIAGGAALQYLSVTENTKLEHISNISRIEEEKYVWLDRFTVRNLELIHSHNENATTLIDIIDDTLTPMGSRLLKRWLVLPLKDEEDINERLNAVESLLLPENNQLRFELGEILNDIGDLERLVSKAAVGKINPKEVIQLKKTLEQIEPIQKILKATNAPDIIKIADRLEACSELIVKVNHQLHPEPAIQIGKGSVIADGFNEELDELRKIAFSGKDYLQQLQEREIEKTGIPSLKVAFNNVFGYYLEVRNTHKDKVPEEWIRKQTLVNAERYITQELKEYESKILGAEDKIQVLESRLYNDLVLSLSKFIRPVQRNAHYIGQIDCLLSFANISEKNNYNKPELNDGFALNIKEGRHPVIEKQLKSGEEYVANDVYLDNDTQQIIMITGPNMSGKSAILRQTALISLMAQIGCFVPAKSAKLGIVDKIFTRVGASDNISSGESTFMVEMNETSSILNNLSPRSLVLLDEIGRGTSTYDGISIAWAIAEYLHENPKAKCKTLFATHYHELNEMYKKFPRIKNFNVSVKEMGTKILFIRKLVEGGSEHSFGIHVAKLAGMPSQVVQRATKMLAHLEQSHGSSDKEKVQEAVNQPDMQLSFFQLDDPVLENIKEELVSIDIDTLTPVEALMKLNEIKKMVGGN
ncbi:DNA mismatch repair protein MutS [Lishizhenia tianjinensis]|uniref:DNA mismatch repair protein MutS n=1 Tax=Lishizhenia tianjinensis TaxID=477690 RepID=A0A1I7BL59_9FLAO|nr:DNA mismatch repair protein MutS [Lishizhenia tianjinensis]SFT87924.1 DNA mismatch repair protein MutS [Lishizhenia tianjinensis]